MDVQIEKLSPVLIELSVQIDADTVKAEVASAYTSLKKTARVAGFRKGKAPTRVLKQIYGRAVRADVAQRLVESKLQQALTDKDVQPLTQPDVAPVDLKPSEPFSFKARFEVRPEVEKVEWKGLAATRGSADVDDAKVDEEIEKLRLQHSTLEPVERAAEKGDTVTISLNFELDGDEKTEDLETEVGKGEILADLDAALEGMKADETKEVSTSFADNHPNEQIRGKEVAFKLKVVEVKERKLPDVDDEFAKDCDLDDLATLKATITDKLEVQLKQQVDEELAKQLVAQLCEKNPIPVPPSLVQQQSQMTERELQMMARLQGQPLTVTAELQAQVRADSEAKVRAGLLMAEIAKENDLKVTDDDIEQGYKELAEQSGKNIAKVKAEYRERQKREMLIGMILEDKVLDLLEGSAEISEA